VCKATETAFIGKHLTAYRAARRTRRSRAEYIAPGGDRYEDHSADTGPARWSGARPERLREHVAEHELVPAAESLLLQFVGLIGLVELVQLFEFGLLFELVQVAVSFDALGLVRFIALDAGSATFELDARQHAGQRLGIVAKRPVGYAQHEPFVVGPLRLAEQ
jgi:hypothetical protein